MAMAERRAHAQWEGALASGKGDLEFASSGIGRYPITWASRVEQADGRTSPEELLAAAHAACYAMAFSHALAEAGHTPEQVSVEATCHFTPVEGGGFSISRMDLAAHGRVPGLDQAAFTQHAEAGERGCPVSNALRGNVDIRLSATLEA